MELLDRVWPTLLRWAPAVVTLVVGGALLMGIDRLLRLRETREDTGLIVRQLVMLGLTAILVIAFVFALDVESSQKNQLLSLLGLLLSAAIALSSTTFLGNAIAGLMVRAVEHFKPGDFIQVGDHFGRVTERGLLHVEIQTEARDLVTIPTLHLVQNPVEVVRASGTIVSADVSLGYDVDHVAAEQLLLAAAESAGLSDAFVRIMELHDHAVCYRVSGFLKEVKHLITARSRLRGHVLDALHGGGVEIVSPTFMNQRRLDPERRFVADPALRSGRPASEENAAGRPEDIVFDKAESAALREKLRDRHERLVAARAQLKEKKAGDTPEERERAAQRLERLDQQIERLSLAMAEEPEVE